MTLFNSSDTLRNMYQSSPFLSKNRDLFNMYHAHSHNKKKPETLLKHTQLVMEYTLALTDAHRLEPVIHRLIESLVINKQIEPKHEIALTVKELFLNAILLHDAGKLNENFQRIKMKNSEFKSKVSNSIGSKHSILSAYIFISYHLNRIIQNNELNDAAKNLLFIYTLYFSCPMQKHHASFIEKKLEFPNELVIALSPYLEKTGIEISLESLAQFLNDNLEENCDKLNDAYISKECAFHLFALLKLCYSLLTASDYYATSDFMMDLPITDFGTLDSETITELVQQFQTSKSYNKDFFDRREQIQQYPISKIDSCSPDNLNLLRGKILNEVIEQIQQNPDKNIFYLEAPTGSGKTNVSIAAALELLKSTNAINKIYYVFPFTTLITQTAKSLIETLNLSSDQIIQLHSRSGYSAKRDEQEDGAYNRNYIDHLFVNYPVTLLTHIKFFDILKNNSKETNYMLHRLANSIVIIDELQSYPPLEWDKITYFINNYAWYFNIKFILMSATLPKLNQLDVIKTSLNVHTLIKNKNMYFQNPNFKNRVNFNFSLVEKDVSLESLSSFLLKKSELYAEAHKNNIKVIIEFIFKQTASHFYNTIIKAAEEKGYKVLLLSGTILEPRRREIIDFIKSTKDNKKNAKILLISTQVVEAGVDIDMDIGFKDQSLIDSDEQLAGRVNRNARPVPAEVFIFKLDSAHKIYGSDMRFRITRDQISKEQYQNILANKDFDFLYKKVCEKINKENQEDFIINLNDYKSTIHNLNFRKVDNEFRLINQRNASVFVPLDIPAKHFSKQDLIFLSDVNAYNGAPNVSGNEVWHSYLGFVQNKNIDFVNQKINLKKFSGIMSQFMFSIFFHSKLLKELLRFCDIEYYEKYKILYLFDWRKVYDYKYGINDDEFSEPAFI